MKVEPILMVLAISAAMSSTAQGQAIRVEGPAAGQMLARMAITDLERSGKASAPVSLGVSGTGTALQKLCRGEVDIATASRPILRVELERCQAAGVEFVEAPVAFDAIVLVVNSRNTFAGRLTLNELHAIWAERPGKPTRWSEVDAAFPDRPLKLYGLDRQFEGASYFNEAVLGPGAASRRDYTASVDEIALVRAVERDPLALAYVSLSTWSANQAKLKALAIAGTAGATPVLPTPETLASGAYRPLARPIFVYVRLQASGSAPVRALAEHWITHGARLAGAAGLVPFSESTYQAGLARVQNSTRGSAWEGTIAVGASMKEVEQRQRPM